MSEDKKYFLVEAQKKNSDSGDITLIPAVNIIPAIIYALVITNQLLPGDWSFGQKFGVGLAFVIVYTICSFVPFVSIIVAIASTIMFVGMAWALCDKLGNQVVRIILKIITAGFVGLIEFAIAIYGTLRK